MIVDRCTGLVLFALLMFRIPLWVGGVLGLVALVLVAALLGWLFWFGLNAVCGDDTTEDAEMADDKYRWECDHAERLADADALNAMDNGWGAI